MKSISLRAFQYTAYMLVNSATVVTYGALCVGIYFVGGIVPVYYAKKVGGYYAVNPRMGNGCGYVPSGCDTMHHNYAI